MEQAEGLFLVYPAPANLFKTDVILTGNYTIFHLALVLRVKWLKKDVQPYRQKRSI